MCDSAHPPLPALQAQTFAIYIKIAPSLVHVQWRLVLEMPIMKDSQSNHLLPSLDSHLNSWEWYGRVLWCTIGTPVLHLSALIPRPVSVKNLQVEIGSFRFYKIWLQVRRLTVKLKFNQKRLLFQLTCFCRVPHLSFRFSHTVKGNRFIRPYKDRLTIKSVNIISDPPFPLHSSEMWDAKLVKRPFCFNWKEEKNDVGNRLSL